MHSKIYPEITTRISHWSAIDIYHDEQCVSVMFNHMISISEREKPKLKVVVFELRLHAVMHDVEYRLGADANEQQLFQDSFPPDFSVFGNVQSVVVSRQVYPRQNVRNCQVVGVSHIWSTFRRVVDG